MHSTDYIGHQFSKSNTGLQVPCNLPCNLYCSKRKFEKKREETDEVARISHSSLDIFHSCFHNTINYESQNVEHMYTKPSEIYRLKFPGALQTVHLKMFRDSILVVISFVPILCTSQLCRLQGSTSSGIFNRIQISILHIEIIHFQKCITICIIIRIIIHFQCTD